MNAELFSKPLIVGASISADWAALSPGKRLAHRHSRSHSMKSDVRVIARSGQPGSKTLVTVTSGTLADRSIVIGLDLFFWDSARGSLKESRERFQWLVEETAKLGIPLVVGDVPEILAGFQPKRDDLNKMIRAAGATYKHVYVLPLEELFVKILTEGSIEIAGKSYSYFDLVPDGLHVGDVAADFLADVIQKTLAQK